MSERRDNYFMRRSGQSEFSLLLRSARLRSGILQIDIKSHIGIPQCKISNYECDKQLPCRRNLNKLMNLYEVSPEERRELVAEWSREMSYLTNVTAK